MSEEPWPAWRNSQNKTKRATGWPKAKAGELLYLVNIPYREEKHGFVKACTETTWLKAVSTSQDHFLEHASFNIPFLRCFVRLSTWVEAGHSRTEE